MVPKGQEFLMAGRPGSKWQEPEAERSHRNYKHKAIWKSMTLNNLKASLWCASASQATAYISPHSTISWVQLLKCIQTTTQSLSPPPPGMHLPLPCDDNLSSIFFFFFQLC